MKNILFLATAFILLAGCKPGPPSSGEEPEQESSIDVKVVDKGNVSFGDYFLDKTMRVDYFHTGNFEEEKFAVDRVVSDGPWPGSTTQLIDKLELGPYFFEVIDKSTGILLYSRGFANIFGEWQTIPEATERWGTFHESIRFPWPHQSVTVIMKKRNAENVFEAIWTTDIDPSYRQVNPADIVHHHEVFDIQVSGPASEKVDIVVLGDGYSKGERNKFKKDAQRLSEVFFDVEPFSRRKNDINIRAVYTPAEVTGVNKPHPGIYKRNPLATSFSSFDSERYVLTYDNRTVRDVASTVPYDFMVILVNEETYGGGGIYMLYTTVSVDNKFSDYIMVHEFGHHFGALGDEYYTSSVSYEALGITVEPWEPNVTALLDKDNLKWKELVEEGTPIPTPWNKEAFDRHGYEIQKERDSLRAAKVPESVVEDLFIRQYNAEDEFFAAEEYKDKVGAFEGAGYMAKGLYRPQLDCIMYTRHMKFCKVCQHGLSDVIDQYSR